MPLDRKIKYKHKQRNWRQKSDRHRIQILNMSHKRWKYSPANNRHYNNRSPFLGLWNDILDHQRKDWREDNRHQQKHGIRCNYWIRENSKHPYSSLLMKFEMSFSLNFRILTISSVRRLPV